FPLMEIVKEELDRDMTYDELMHYMSFPGPKSLELLNIKNSPTVYERWVKYVNAYKHGASIYYNFDELIRSLDNKIIQGVVSSKKREQYIIDIKGKKIHDCFSAIVLLEDTKKHKPDAEPLLHCAKILNVAPENCLYVGDSLSDFESANKAKMDFAFASWGSLEPEKFKNTTYTLNYPNDLLDVIF
ncbi:HAD family hydrolase, partial [Carnobacterium sp.]|uniref:HAD family hydrolase n=1 Tax=Carnobacterium sp. TaxID=48221 RepID=UPI003C722003